METCAGCGTEFSCPGCSPDARAQRKEQVQMRRENKDLGLRVTELEILFWDIGSRVRAGVDEVILNRDSTRYPEVFELREHLNKLEGDGWKTIEELGG